MGYGVFTPLPRNSVSPAALLPHTTAPSLTALVGGDPGYGPWHTRHSTRTPQTPLLHTRLAWCRAHCAPQSRAHSLHSRLRQGPCGTTPTHTRESHDYNIHIASHRQYRPLSMDQACGAQSMRSSAPRAFWEVLDPAPGTELLCDDSGWPHATVKEPPVPSMLVGRLLVCSHRLSGAPKNNRCVAQRGWRAEGLRQTPKLIAQVTSCSGLTHGSSAGASVAAASGAGSAEAAAGGAGGAAGGG